LTDPAGDTADLLRRARTGTVAPLDSTGEISAALPAFVQRLRANIGGPSKNEFTSSCSRRERTRVLGTILDDVSRCDPAPTRL
jgi:hypothetical protein